MELQWLREFVQLSKTLNFRKAASMLYVTPSTLSKHVAVLERELDSRLLIRDTKSVQLTEAGCLFRDSAALIVREYDAVSRRLSGEHTIQGNLRIGGAVRFPRLNEVIHPVIARFEKKYPDVNIYLEDIQFKDYREALMNGAFDAVFSLRLPNMNCEGLDFRDLFSLPFCLWVDESSPLANRSSVSLAELGDMKLRVLDQDSCELYLSYLKDMFDRHGVRIHLGKPLSQAFTMEGDGFGVTPGFSPSEYFGSGVCAVAIKEDETAVFCLVRRQHISNPIAVLFYEEFKEVYDAIFGREKEDLPCGCIPGMRRAFDFSPVTSRDDACS